MWRWRKSPGGLAITSANKPICEDQQGNGDINYFKHLALIKMSLFLEESRRAAGFSYSNF